MFSFTDFNILVIISLPSGHMQQFHDNKNYSTIFSELLNNRPFIGGGHLLLSVLLLLLLPFLPAWQISPSIFMFFCLCVCLSLFALLAPIYLQQNTWKIKTATKKKEKYLD